MCKRDGSCGCGCPSKGQGKTMRGRRDTPRQEDRASYRFATAAALVRQERMTGPQARQAVQEASAIVDSRMRQGASPASTARYVASLPTTRSSYPPPARDNGPPSGVWFIVRKRGQRFSRDPAPRKRNQTRAYNGRKRAEAGAMKVSAKGNPYRVCPRGTRIQTLIFPLAQFSEKKAAKWARDHGFRIQKIDLTSQSIRIRQQPVELFTKGSFRTITLPSRTGTIRAVIGCPRFAIIAGGRARQRPQEERRQPARRQARRLRRAA